MQTDLYIGPLIERDGRFAYDTFSRSDGLRSSFRYPRIEQARYDRRAMIAELRRDPRTRIQVCETMSEFERQLTEAQPGPENRESSTPRKP
jgi:hypothetical protein